MSLQIITGDLAVDKKTPIIHHLLKIKQQDPSAEIYYIVPEHMKFDMESLMLETIQKYQEADQAAMIDIQVASFTRLSWFLMPKEMTHQTGISDSGLAMLIQQILIDHQEQLTLLAGQVNQMGFVDKLLDLFIELYDGNVEPADLLLADSSLSSSTNPIDPMLLDHLRLSEIQLLYQAFIDRVEPLALASDLSYQHLFDYLEAGHSDRIKSLYIVIDHYQVFNAKQVNLILQLAKYCRWLAVSLPCSQEEALVWNQVNQPLLNTSLRTYHQLKDLASFMQVDLLADWQISEPFYAIKPELMQLANTARDYLNLKPISTQIKSLSADHLQVFEMDTPVSELVMVTNEIDHLVKEGGYRYQDIVVLTRDLGRYQATYQHYFDRNQVPVFYDNQTLMEEHHLVIWLEAFLNLPRYHYQYTDLMTVLKSDLFTPDWLSDDEGNLAFESWQHQLAIVENIMLANGYFSYRFNNPSFDWEFETRELAYMDQEGQELGTLGELLDRYRQWFNVDLVQSFAFWDQEVSGSQASHWLYQCLIASRIRKRLENKRDQAILQGAIGDSRQYEQVWANLMAILEEFHDLYGQSTITYNHFCDLLLAGLKQATFHIIPPTLDQVTFTNIESPRIRPYKVAFVIGLDDQALPKATTNDSLLREEDRQQIIQHLLPHQSLLADPALDKQQENLFAYQLFLTASNRLYLTYARQVGEASRQFSPLIRPIVEKVSSGTSFFSESPNFMTMIDSPHTYEFGSERSIFASILKAIQVLAREADSLPTALQAILRYLTSQKDAQSHYLVNLIPGLFNFSKLPKNISPNLALKLYGKDIYASISKIEQYYQDPYSHFLTYGLKLQERDRYEITPAKSGDYFHHFLDLYMRLAQSKKLVLSQAGPKDLDQLFTETCQLINVDSRFDLFRGHPRLSLVESQIQQQLNYLTQVISYQSRLNHFQPYLTETVFGRPGSESIPGFKYQLTSGGHLTINGKIDRIDCHTSQDLFQVIDYKSTEKKFNLVDAYYGLDLQLLTYLAVASQYLSNQIPLGAFYQPIMNDYQIVESKDLAKEVQPSDFYPRFQGLLSIDGSTLSTVDASLQDQTSSRIYPVQVKKNGDYYAYVNYFNSEELTYLLKHTQTLIRQAAESIQAGHIEFQPFYENQFTLSLKHPYRVITGFDPTEDYQVYRHKQMDSKQVLEELARIYQEEDTDE
ncbi:PD-(D/E)XK nuclease family protein [Hutsoniella sourekii]|uniref:PD-(D/E)XK nuclease family protein n=1 Tax=Hutsoniella sourekii TaxID=87650 RepID=UPI000489734F|nr:PD-(D/E)XK nuclease family protein [Hutsoniella sourekii]